LRARWQGQIAIELAALGGADFHGLARHWCLMLLSHNRSAMPQAGKARHCRFPLRFHLSSGPTRKEEEIMERVPQPIMDKRGEPHMKGFEDQRWVLDNIARANGIDWDQPRSIYISAPCGPEGTADIVGVRERVKKMADIAPAFEAVARRREAKAKAAGGAGSTGTERGNYFMAAVDLGAAAWPHE